ncbi:uncharacterized protein A4U43_C01F8470 [Asparagus officinalis]|uniref:CASP-like protein n=1 Tax=Asparagus officinalis TaxID=4686 RepID=A0A5P1FNN5_ASPOF|nr:uncharacterized protein A4U43_C01F8470 [Asparagus officinalis]
MTEAAEAPARVRMKDSQGMPGTHLGLALRLFQFLFAVAALCAMAATNDFTSVTAFCVSVLSVAGIADIFGILLDAMVHIDIVGVL